jgi:ATP:ADP antiporter, AAA family
VTAVLARYASPIVLLLGAAVLLEVAVFAVGRLSRLAPVLHQARGEQADETVIGGGVIAGIAHTVRSPYLLNVSLFMLLYSITSTVLYFQQAGIVSHRIPERAVQIAFFAKVDLIVDVLTLGAQIFLTGCVLLACGVAVTLALLPALSVIGFGALALFPTIGAVVAFQVLRRAGNFAITRPTREVLFTVVSREDRFKAKGFIDTFVYRLGDQVGAWSSALLVGLGGGTSVAALVAIPISCLWLVNSVWLGRRQEKAAAGLPANHQDR